MSKARDKRRTLLKKAERAERRQARLAASQQTRSLGSDAAEAETPPAMPADADSSVSQNSNTLPATTVPHSLQQSGQSESGSDQDSDPPVDAGGLGGLNATPPYWRAQQQGIRDARLIRQLLRRKDWEMPANLEIVAPRQMANVMANLDDRGRPLPEDKRYTVGHRIAATKCLQDMARDNDRRLVAAVRLSQLNRRTKVIEEHPEALAGGSGNVTNNVVIYLPTEAPMEKYAVDDPPKVIDAQPSGNGNGRTK